MVRFLLYTALAFNFSTLALTAADRMADGCSNNREAMCVRCHSSKRSNSTIRSKHRNSGSFVIKGKIKECRRNTHTF